MLKSREVIIQQTIVGKRRKRFRQSSRLEKKVQSREKRLDKDGKQKNESKVIT